MSFRIRVEETVGESIRRIVREQIEDAILVSSADRNGGGSPVHETRKHLKKARAALRLLAAEVPRESFRREDRRLRNIGRLISGIRDAEVRLETVKHLRKSSRARPGSSFAQTEELLAFELDSFLAAFDGWQDETVSRLRRVQQGIASWELDHITPAKICRSVRRSYKLGRRALKAATKKGGAARHHEVRKRAKELVYQLRLLRPLDPPAFRELIEQLDALGDHLGHAHDLCFLAERLHGLPGAAAGKRGRKAIQALIESREQDLQRVARSLAERFFADKPKEFATRIAKYFDCWPCTPALKPLTRTARATAAP